MSILSDRRAPREAGRPSARRNRPAETGTLLFGAAAVLPGAGTFLARAGIVLAETGSVLAETAIVLPETGAVRPDTAGLALDRGPPASNHRRARGEARSGLRPGPEEELQRPLDGPGLDDVVAVEGLQR